MKHYKTNCFSSEESLLNVINFSAENLKACSSDLIQDYTFIIQIHQQSNFLSKFTLSIQNLCTGIQLLPVKEREREREYYFYLQSLFPSDNCIYELIKYTPCDLKDKI